MSNETLENRYLAISEELEQYDYNPCDCNRLELKIREFGGGVHYVKQCNNCGRQKGGSIKKADALVSLNGCSPRAFDPTIEEIYDNQYKVRVETRSKLWKEKMALELEMSGRSANSFPNFHEIQEKKDKAKEKTDDCGFCYCRRIWGNFSQADTDAIFSRYQQAKVSRKREKHRTFF
ncbi:hypothetical protein MID13_07510 [Vibrio gigantis]|uniref:hypothetical protein n=1 Tax=Vibrio gigantis TaxID=296199 RepID=UPI001EFB6077|nr:hypothetical protein [Vibrio gigantis]ULN65632.1 hypothetical protein MID13_07510 [Vibrio gigantis]